VAYHERVNIIDVLLQQKNCLLALMLCKYAPNLIVEIICVFVEAIVLTVMPI
jgi:hypothetical protein